ncbi:MAG: DUF3987 domain-containing protein [Pleurocapsa sp. MO_226.B13]|nr:DUF3987 domain-containing protein [Pleurocapsa sp. MO_226.B13]
MQKHHSTLSDRLIRGLRHIQNSKLALPLVPLGGNKQPLGDRWQNRPFTADELIDAIATGGVSVPIKGQIKKIQLQGYGLLTGRPITIDENTYYLMAVDQDGPSAIDKIAELSFENSLPKTVAFASGRPGRCQYLFLIPEQYKNAIKTKKIKTGAIGDDGKGEQLEFRWKNLQSVLPPSVHPTTGSYRWVEDRAIDETEIAFAPDWIIQQMLIEPLEAKRQSASSRGITTAGFSFAPVQGKWTEIDYALSYLDALSSFRADDYDQWLAVGMALHNVDDSLLDEWDRWSARSAKYKSGDCQRKWRSFSTGGGVKLGTLAYMAKQDGWQSPFTNYQSNHSIPQSEPKINDRSYSSNGNESNGKGDRASRKHTTHSNDSNGRDEIKIRELLLSILQQNLSASAQTEAINSLSASWGWSVRELRTLLEQIETDLERQENRSEHQQQLQQLTTYKQSSLNLDLYLPESIARPITKVANWMEAPTAAYLVVLLSAIASCCDPRTRIIVKESINFIEPAIIYGGIVTESGQRKSPILNTILDGIKQLQVEEEERYKLAKADYDGEYQAWQRQKDTLTDAEWKDSEPTAPNPLKEFFIDKTTIEAIDRIKGEQPDTAFLWIKDELSGLFSSYGAYKKGKGDDRESVLSSWNGRGIKKNLKGGERVFVPYDALSIIGAIQDTTLQKLMGDLDDAQGEWGRFLWALIPLKALKLPRTDTKFQLAFLKSLYQKARQLAPQKYRFDPEAQQLYDNFHWQLEQRRVMHPQPGMRAAISKMEGYTARLALVLHLIWELEAGHTTPSLSIPSARVEAAIALAEFFLSQVTLIHSEGCAAKGMGGLTPRLNAILNKLEQFGELTARKLQSAIFWLRKEKPDKIRQDLIELAKLGYGKLVGTGNRLKLVLSVDRDADRNVERSINDETQDSSGFGPSKKSPVERSIAGDYQLHEQDPSGQEVGNRQSAVGYVPKEADISPRKSVGDVGKSPTGKTTLSPTSLSLQGEEQNSQNGSDDRPLDSSDRNRELVSFGAIDNRSTSTSTVATVSQTAVAAEFENCIVTESSSPQVKRQSSEIVNLIPLVLGMKVFTHLVGQALAISEDAVEPDLVTPIVEYGGYETLARLLLRCETPEAFAVLRSIFPPTLLFESLTCISNWREQLASLKNLESQNNTNGNNINSPETNSELLSHQPIYVYWGESKNGEEVESNDRNLKSEQYLDKGTLVVVLHCPSPHGSSPDITELVENTATTSSDDLAVVQILGRPNSCYRVKHHELIQLC